jgi:hypothetical protein
MQPGGSKLVRKNELRLSHRSRAKRELLETFQGLLPQIRGQNLVETVLYVPYSPDSGLRQTLAALTTQGPSNLNQTSISEGFVNVWPEMPTKWLQ